MADGGRKGLTSSNSLYSKRSEFATCRPEADHTFRRQITATTVTVGRSAVAVARTQPPCDLNGHPNPEQSRDERPSLALREGPKILATATTPIASSGWTASRIVRLGMFASAKDIGESMAAIQAACRHGLAKGDKSERGRLRGWECVSTNTALKKEDWCGANPQYQGCGGIDRLWGHYGGIHDAGQRSEK